MSDKPEKGERVFYIRDEARNPVGIVAYSVVDSPLTKAPIGVYFGTSFLHPNDDFNKVRGRQIALGRLRNDADFALINDTTILMAVLLGVLRAQETPHRIKKLLLRGY
jgi:hypothetical protein